VWTVNFSMLQNLLHWYWRTQFSVTDAISSMQNFFSVDSLQLVCMIVQEWPVYCSAVSNMSAAVETSLLVSLSLSLTAFSELLTCDIFKGWGWCWQIWNMKEMDFWLFLCDVAVNFVLWFNVLSQKNKKILICSVVSVVLRIEVLFTKM
jgi:hypothetical protein